MGTGAQVAKYSPVSFSTAGTDIANATITSILVSPVFGVMRDSNYRYYFWGKHSGSQLAAPTTIPRFRILSAVVYYPNYMPLPSDVTSVALGINTLFATRSGGGIYIW